MQDVSTKNFGLLIAYLIPGFATLWGVSYFSPVVRSWLGSTADSSPSVGGFLYVTLASVSAGLTVSTIRWLVIDSIHHHTGIQQPNWDFSRLGQTVAAYDVLKEIHYRYFQFYALCRVLHKAYYADQRIMLTTGELKRLDDQRGIVLPWSSGCCMPWP